MPISGLALVALFLGSMMGNPPTVAQTALPSCADYDDDRAYLMDVIVGISPGPHGPTVEVTRASDGTVLRESYPDSEQFYVDYSGGALDIQYQITAQCGGFDVVYTLSNPAASWADAQPQPELRVEGLRMATSGDVYMLRTKDFGNVQKLPWIDQNGNVNTIFSVGPYPSMVYSPVIVEHDSVLAVGSALHYPVLSPGYRNAVTPFLERMISGPQEGTWKHRYLNFFEDAGGAPPVPTTVPPGEQREYKISVRFADRHFWLLTLFPYKQYFESLYSTSSDVRPRDRRPVFATGTAVLMAADSPEWPTNPRSFVSYIGVDGNQHRVDIDGWGPFTALTISEMTTLGYDRVMIWTPSGLYGPDMPAFGFNFPPQFMSDWLPMMVKTQGELSAFADNKISLGMWWGRSSQIPVPLQWNPKALDDARYTNPAHIALLTNELKLALERGSNEIGLDAFVQMPTYERYVWVDDMKKLAPGALFLHEGAGPDVLHSKMGNYYVPHIWNGQQVEAPDVLSAYLNPGSEIWVQTSWTTWNNFETIQNLVQWGFTPAVRSYPDVDVRGLDDTLVQCFDGIDNDGDGSADWPYDADCATAAGLSEKPIFQHPLDLVTSRVTIMAHAYEPTRRTNLSKCACA